MRHNLISLLALLPILVAGASHAQEVKGTIEATLDGEAREWVTIFYEQEGAENSSASFSTIMDGQIAAWAIQGYKTPSGPMFEEVINIDFSQTSFGDGNPKLADASISYFPDGMVPNYSTNDGGSAEIEILEVTEGSEVRSIKGRFKGTMVYHESFNNVDTSRTMDVEGSFDVQAMNLEP